MFVSRSISGDLDSWACADLETIASLKVAPVKRLHLLSKNRLGKNRLGAFYREYIRLFPEERTDRSGTPIAAYMDVWTSLGRH